MPARDKLTDLTTDWLPSVDLLSEQSVVSQFESGRSGRVGPPGETRWAGVLRTCVRLINGLTLVYTAGRAMLRPRSQDRKGVTVISAIDAARYLLANQDPSFSEPISNLKLQKLLYYAQGYHLALFGSPLFTESVQAWSYGPVVPVAYYAYSSFRGRPIAATEPGPIGLTDNAIEVLDNVLRGYGRLSAAKLTTMTHAESPWLDGKTSGLISAASMTVFFRSMLSRPSTRGLSPEMLATNPAFRAALAEAKADVTRGNRIRWRGPRTSSPST